MAKLPDQNTWKHVHSLKECIELCDRGIVLTSADIKHVTKILNDEDKRKFSSHLGNKFAERSHDRLAQELIMESFLNVLFAQNSEELLKSFLESILQSGPSASKQAELFVEVSLMMQYVDQTNEKSLQALAVSCVCELGLAIKASGENFPGTVKEKNDLLSHISTYLLSLGNSDQASIRYSLLNYFACVEAGMDFKPSLSKVLNRFGHTALDQLFSLLFQKKSEVFALQYLTHIMPFLLETDRNGQQILHDTLRFYMLKKPERFGLFLQSIANTLLIAPAELKTAVVWRNFLQHCSVLFGVANELGHRELGGEILSAVAKFQEQTIYHSVIQSMLENKTLRRPFKDLLEDVKKISTKPTHVQERISRFMNLKRGRKPSFSKADNLQTAQLMSILGEQEIEHEIAS